MTTPGNIARPQPGSEDLGHSHGKHCKVALLFRVFHHSLATPLAAVLHTIRNHCWRSSLPSSLFS